MKLPIRTWIWKDPIQVKRMGHLYNMRRSLSDDEIDYLNCNYFILNNDQLGKDFYTNGIDAIRQLGISGLDWYYLDGFFIFTNDDDRVLVYLTML